MGKRKGTLLMRTKALAAIVLLFVISMMLSASVSASDYHQAAPTATPAPARYGNYPPDTFVAALTDLGKRVGKANLALTDFDNPTSQWLWINREFTDSALNCAAPGEAFAPNLKLLGYEFVFVYLGKTYDYRVPQDDASKLRYCQYPDKLPPLPTLAPTAQATTATTFNATLDPNATPGANTSNTTPQAVLDALADLNTRLKLNLALSDFETGTNFWRWDARTYTNDALECPKTGYTPIVGTYNGYIITFFYKGITYQYRASDNPKQVFLCKLI
jgi:hypothetical protein